MQLLLYLVCITKSIPHLWLALSASQLSYLISERSTWRGDHCKINHSYFVTVQELLWFHFLKQCIHSESVFTYLEFQLILYMVSFFIVKDWNFVLCCFCCIFQVLQGKNKWLVGENFLRICSESQIMNKTCALSCVSVLTKWSFWKLQGHSMQILPLKWVLTV